MATRRIVIHQGKVFDGIPFKKCPACDGRGMVPFLFLWMKACDTCSCLGEVPEFDKLAEAIKK